MDKKMPKFAKRLLVIVPCAIAALIVVAGCFDIVPAGYKGVKLTMGAVGDTVLNEGLAFKLPFAQRIVHVDARVKKYTVEGETSASKDMQSITTNVAVGLWADVFGDAVTAAAIADRVCHHCTMLKITGRSYRMKDLLAEAADGDGLPERGQS